MNISRNHCESYMAIQAKKLVLRLGFNSSMLIAFQVRNKSWFGVLNVLTLMCKDWTVLREASNAIMAMSNGEIDPCLHCSEII